MQYYFRMSAGDNITDRSKLRGIEITDISKGHASLASLKFCIMECFQITWNWLFCAKPNIYIDNNTFQKKLAT